MELSGIAVFAVISLPADSLICAAASDDCFLGGIAGIHAGAVAGCRDDLAVGEAEYEGALLVAAVELRADTGVASEGPSALEELAGDVAEVACGGVGGLRAGGLGADGEAEGRHRRREVKCACRLACCCSSDRGRSRRRGDRDDDRDEEDDAVHGRFLSIAGGLDDPTVEVPRVRVAARWVDSRAPAGCSSRDISIWSSSISGWGRVRSLGGRASALPELSSRHATAVPASLV